MLFHKNKIRKPKNISLILSKIVWQYLPKCMPKKRTVIHLLLVFQWIALRLFIFALVKFCCSGQQLNTKLKNSAFHQSNQIIPEQETFFLFEEKQLDYSQFLSTDFLTPTKKVATSWLKVSWLQVELIFIGLNWKQLFLEHGKSFKIFLIICSLWADGGSFFLLTHRNIKKTSSHCNLSQCKWEPEHCTVFHSELKWDS